MGHNTKLALGNPAGEASEPRSNDGPQQENRPQGDNRMGIPNVDWASALKRRNTSTCPALRRERGIRPKRAVRGAHDLAGSPQQRDLVSVSMLITRLQALSDRLLLLHNKPPSCSTHLAGDCLGHLRPKCQDRRHELGHRWGVRRHTTYRTLVLLSVDLLPCAPAMRFHRRWRSAERLDASSLCCKPVSRSGPQLGNDQAAPAAKAVLRIEGTGPVRCRPATQDSPRCLDLKGKPPWHWCSVLFSRLDVLQTTVF